MKIVTEFKDWGESVVVKPRHALIPACVSFGPFFMTRMCGLMDGNIGAGLVWVGTFLLTAGLYMMFELIGSRPEFIEGLKAHGLKDDPKSAGQQHQSEEE